MILDTNALSAFGDDIRPVVQQIATADELHIPVIVLGEYRFGIATSRRRREYEAWLARGRAFWNIIPPSGGDCHALRIDSAATEESWRPFAR
jgi:predicted nucleic acid-binding protein